MSDNVISVEEELNMDTWIFSKNGQVTEPLTLAAAKEYVVENQDAYGWQSHYTQWLPVNSISEFSALLPDNKAIAKIPQKIIDEFLSKEQALDKRFDQFNQELITGDAAAKQLEQEIATYKQLTVNLSDEVKSNINEIEQQYHELQKQLNDIKQVVETSHQGLSDIARDFNHKVADKPVLKKPLDEKPSQAAASVENKSTSQATKLAEKTPPKKPTVAKLVPTQVSKVTANAEVNNSTETKLKDQSVANTEVASTASVEPSVEKKELEANDTEIKPKVEGLAGLKAISTRAPKPVGAKVISTRSNQPTSAKVISTSAIASDKAEEKDLSFAKQEPKETTAKEQVSDLAVQEKSTTTKASKPQKAKGEDEGEQTDNLQAKLESGVKNIFKSVFTKEEPVSAKSMFTELIEKDAQSSDVKETEAEPEPELAVGDDDSTKTRRRRRRR